MDKHIDTILDAIHLDENKRKIIAIDGLSRSGKTTLVKRLSERLDFLQYPYCILHIDDYIVAREKRYHTKHPQWYEYYQLQWDVDMLIKRLFKNLTTSQTLQLPLYVEETDSHQMQEVTLPKSGVVIIEGVFLQRPEWKKYFDYVIYLDCKREERFKRESLETQTDTEKFEERYWKAETHYLETVQPKAQADIVLHS